MTSSISGFEGHLRVFGWFSGENHTFGRVGPIWLCGAMKVRREDASVASLRTHRWPHRPHHDLYIIKVTAFSAANIAAASDREEKQ